MRTLLLVERGERWGFSVLSVWMGAFDRKMRFFETDHLAHLGAKAAVRFRSGSGPTTPLTADQPDDHSVLRRYAKALQLDVADNMLVAMDAWLVVTGGRLLVSRPGPFRQMPAELLWEMPLAGASLVWLEHKRSHDDSVVMFHLTCADGRFVLGDVHLDDDGDPEGFIDAFDSNAHRVDTQLAQRVLLTD